MQDKVKWTPGPWAWFGNDRGIYLAATHSERRFVMGFRRMGMRDAQPEFQVNSVMVPASELVQFAVGDPSVRGFKAGKENTSTYRYDITAIDHPDAHLIAAAPEMVEALKLWQASDEETNRAAAQTARQIAREKRDAALARAQGRS